MCFARHDKVTLKIGNKVFAESAYIKADNVGALGVCPGHLDGILYHL